MFAGLGKRWHAASSNTRSQVGPPSIDPTPPAMTCNLRGPPHQSTPRYLSHYYCVWPCRDAEGPKLMNVQPAAGPQKCTPGRRRLPGTPSKHREGVASSPFNWARPPAASRTPAAEGSIRPSKAGHEQGPHSRGVIKLPTWPVAPGLPRSPGARSSRLCTVHIQTAAVPREMVQQFVSASTAPLARGLAQGCRQSVLG